MATRAAHQMTVEAELRAPGAAAQLVQFQFDEPPNNVFQKSDLYRLDLCLTPRPSNARASYLQHWGGQRFERMGNLFLVPPGESMLVRSDESGVQTSLLMQLNADAMQAWFDEELQWQEPQLSASLDIRDATIQSLLMRLAQEARQPGFASKLLVELIAGQLVIELARYRDQAAQPTAGGGLAPWRLKLIDERLEDTESIPALVELAALCGLSVRQLTRGFRASRGCSIGDYVATSRIENAKKMLATDQSIKAIAYTLGFASPSSFCFAFRRATGETPGQFRQRRLRH